jgi:stage III sporulation protein AH
MMVLKKKQIVAVSLIVLVAAAGFVSWIYAPDSKEPLTVDASPSSSPNAPVSANENIILYDANKEEGKEGADKTGEARYVNGETENGEEGKEVNAGEDSGEVIDETVTATQTYFDDARLQKETAKGKAIEMLNTLIENPSSDKDAKESAQKQILNFANAQKSEAACENIIKAKGFSDCVVFINSENVTVVVKSAKLSESDAAKIQEIITGQVDIDAKNVKIVEVA